MSYNNQRDTEQNIWTANGGRWKPKRKVKKIASSVLKFQPKHKDFDVYILTCFFLPKFTQIKASSERNQYLRLKSSTVLHHSEAAFGSRSELIGKNTTKVIILPPNWAGTISVNASCAGIKSFRKQKQSYLYSWISPILINTQFVQLS